METQTDMEKLRSDMLGIRAKMGSASDLSDLAMACAHEWTHRFILDSLQRRQYYFQCKHCGCRGASLKKKEVLLAEPWDYDLENKIWERRRAYKESLREEWKRLYHDVYLQTSYWKDKRARVLKRDAGMCKACERREATEVHHKTYENVCKEPLFDLVSVCRTCHKAIHF
jgi:hypothetical protein